MRDQHARSPFVLKPTPGLVPWRNIAAQEGPVRAMGSMPGFLYWVSNEHLYRVTGFSKDNPGGKGPLAGGAVTIAFQNGPIAEAGVNGLTHEVLLEILIDRLKCFQAGPFANGYNASALLNLEAAQLDLQARTLERMSRGVEGTHKA